MYVYIRVYIYNIHMYVYIYMYIHFVSYICYMLPYLLLLGGVRQPPPPARYRLGPHPTQDRCAFQRKTPYRNTCEGEQPASK